MLFSEILTEGSSPVLYHMTPVEHAVTMIDTATLAPSTNKAEVEHSKGKMFFLSTSRIPNNRYARSNANHGMVTFVLDGRKLGNQFKTNPMDYWGAEFRKIGREQGEYNYEAEDRVLSDKPSIDNFNKYILEVHICVDKGEPITDQATRTLILKAHKAKIPVFMYDSPKAFLILSKNNRKSVSDFEFGTKKPGVRTGTASPSNYLNRRNVFDVDFEGQGKVPADRKHRLEKRYSDLTSVLELITKTEERQLSPAAKKFKYNYISRWNNDSQHRLNADIHNAKANKTSKDYGDALRILSFMNSKKLTTYQQLINYLSDKWNGE